MKKGLALVLAALLVWVVAAPVFAAGNPFADVPAHHWAYDSIVELAAAGLVEGYPDGEFKGDRNFTRYEMAMVFARMLGRMESYLDAGIDAKIGGISDDILEKLAKELADKLNASREELAAYIKETVDKKAAELPEKVVERVVVEKPWTTVVERVVEKPVQQVVEKVVVEKPVHTTIEKTVERPFELTDEAKAVLAKFVADGVAAEMAKIEPKTIERVVETKIIEKQIPPDSKSLTRDEVNELIAIATAAEMLSDSNSSKITSLDEAIKAADAVIKALQEELAAAKAQAEGNAQTAAAEDAKLAAEIAQVKGNVGQVEGSLEETQAKVAKTEGGLAKTQGDLTLMKADLIITEAELAKTQEEVAKTQADLAKANADIATNAGNILVQEGYIAQNQSAIAKAESDIEQLRILLLGLDEDLGGVEAELAQKTSALEEQIAKLTTEFQTELAVLGVKVSQLEYVFQKLETRVDKLETAQKATADELAAFKADHEKVKITGETSTVFEAIGVDVVGGYPEAEAWKDPRKHDIDDDDTDDVYEDSSVLKQELALTLTATPADGVTLIAELLANKDFFGGADADEFGLTFDNLSLSLTTEGVLRGLYAGTKSTEDLTARFHGLVFDAGEAETFFGGDEAQGLVVNLVNGRLDTQVTMLREPTVDDRYVTAIDQEFKLSQNLTLNGEAVLYWSQDSGFTGNNAYLLSASGSALGLAYDFDLATTDFSDTTKGAYAVELGKALDFVNLKLKYAATAENYDAKFGSFSTNQRRLDLAASDMDVLGFTTSAEYVSIDNPEHKAWKLSASKDVQVGLPFTLSGTLASDGTERNQKFSVSMTDHAVTDKVKLSAGFTLENDKITDNDWTDEADWTDEDSRTFTTGVDLAVTDGLTFSGDYKWDNTREDDAAAFAATTTTILGAEYKLAVGAADVTTGYEWKKVNREDSPWDSPQNTYSLKVVAPFFGATLTTEGKVVTGFNDEVDEQTTDKVASFELSYPVVNDVNFTFGGTYVNSVNEAGEGYTVKKLDGGVTFKF